MISITEEEKRVQDAVYKKLEKLEAWRKDSKYIGARWLFKDLEEMKRHYYFAKYDLKIEDTRGIGIEMHRKEKYLFLYFYECLDELRPKRRIKPTIRIRRRKEDDGPCCDFEANEIVLIRSLWQRKKAFEEEVEDIIEHEFTHWILYNFIGTRASDWYDEIAYDMEGIRIVAINENGSEEPSDRYPIIEI